MVSQRESINNYLNTAFSEANFRVLSSALKEQLKKEILDEIGSTNFTAGIVGPPRFELGISTFPIEIVRVAS